MDDWRDGVSERALDKDTHWRDVSDDDIARAWMIFAYLDTKGFRYYIPAYMSWTLRHLDVEDSNSSFHTVSALSASSKKSFVLLNEVQREAICNFLEFMARNRRDHDAQQALDRY